MCDIDVSVIAEQLEFSTKVVTDSISQSNRIKKVQELEDDETEHKREDDAIAVGATLAKMLKLTENVHEASGYLQLWHLVNPRQPTVVLKLFAAPSQVEEIRSSNLVPTTMILPMALLPGDIEVSTGDVSSTLMHLSVVQMLCIVIRCSDSGWTVNYW